MKISSTAAQSKSVGLVHKKNEKLNHLSKSISSKYTPTHDIFKIKKFRAELIEAQTSEEHVQEGVSFLQERNQSVSSLKDMSQKLKQLSDEFSSDKYTDKDKESIKEQAKYLIDNMDNIMNNTFGNSNNSVGKEISIETCHASNIVVDTNKSLNISMDDSISKYNLNNKGMNIEGSLKITDILKDPSKIEKNLIKPLDEYLHNIREEVSSIATDAMYQDMIVNMSVKELCNLGDMDGDTATQIIKNSKSILENANNALRYQSSGLTGDAASRLLS